MWTSGECVLKEEAVGCGKCDMSPKVRSEEWTLDGWRGAQQHGGHWDHCLELKR